jgi:hypothetical protein
LGRLVPILALVLVGAACLPVCAQGAFGLGEFDVTFTDEDGSPASQAGSHPFAFTTSLKTNVSGSELQGRLRELFLDEIPGLVAAPTASPRCKAEDFDTLDEGMNDCSPATAVGIFEGAAGEPEGWTTAPVFNLVPPSGVPLRLGFRVADAANVVVDFELSPEPPYRLIASIGEIPEAIELFAAKLQLWGVPASPLHDALRGGCAVKGGKCSVSIEEQSLLTLPTSCEGPQETFYEALSWEGDEDFGSALTHDGPGDPMGFSGCHKLGFAPLLSAKPTTEEAQSPTGLDVSVAFVDEGLDNPAGIAQSQVRDLTLALPGGMTTDPSLASVFGSCSEADLEAETPAGGSGEGCPESSEIGAAEAESSLVEGQVIHGVVYRATPNENFAGDAAMALYVVLKDQDLGIVIAQPVGLEVDPDTHELIATAEEMPQLPFSRLDLHLDDGVLVSPARCGKYTPEVFFEPWSGEGPFGATSSFSIVSGPHGGPCPAGEPESQLKEAAGSSSAPDVPPASTGPGSPPPRRSAKPRCPRGKHLVRRYGRTHCEKKRQRKNHKGLRHSR